MEANELIAELRRLLRELQGNGDSGHWWVYRPDIPKGISADGYPAPDRGGRVNRDKARRERVSEERDSVARARRVEALREYYSHPARVEALRESVLVEQREASQDDPQCDSGLDTGLVCLTSLIASNAVRRAQAGSVDLRGAVDGARRMELASEEN